MPRREDIEQRKELLITSKTGNKRECGYTIRKKSTRYEVILFKTKNKDYKGIGLELNFENFATRVKKRELRDVHHSKIKWFQWDEWKEECFKDRLLPVKMNFNGISYSNPSWGKEVNLEE
jgi:hypothetical protein